MKWKSTCCDINLFIKSNKIKFIKWYIFWDVIREHRHSQVRVSTLSIFQTSIAHRTVYKPHFIQVVIIQNTVTRNHWCYDYNIDIFKLRRYFDRFLSSWRLETVVYLHAYYLIHSTDDQEISVEPSILCSSNP